jgi:hypothetical protein
VPWRFIRVATIVVVSVEDVDLFNGVNLEYFDLADDLRGFRS